MDSKHGNLRFEAVAHSIPDAVITANSQGRILFWNNSAQTMFGYTPEEVHLQAITYLMPEEYRNRHDRGMERYAETGVPHVIGQVVELKGLRKNGEIFPIELSLSSWEDDGELFFGAIVRDITDRKRTEAQLRQTAHELSTRNAELDAYNHTVAHDLKAPLNLMVTSASLLSFKHTFEPEIQKHIDRIEYAGKQMGHMIDQLLMLATIRDMKITRLEMDMSVIAKTASERFTHLLEADDVTLTIMPNMPTTPGHAPWMEEVFANLIGNAIKYRADRPLILEIGGKQDGNSLKYWVKDNGLGIPEDAKDRLFDMFTRVHPSHNTGLGLGLSIVQRIVTQLNGSLGVDSVEGEGSTFWFTLP